MLNKDNKIMKTENGSFVTSSAGIRSAFERKYRPTYQPNRTKLLPHAMIQKKTNISKHIGQTEKLIGTCDIKKNIGWHIGQTEKIYILANADNSKMPNIGQHIGQTEKHNYWPKLIIQKCQISASISAKQKNIIIG